METKGFIVLILLSAFFVQQLTADETWDMDTNTESFSNENNKYQKKSFFKFRKSQINLKRYHPQIRLGRGISENIIN